MKIKIRPDDTSRLQGNDWLQTDGWLAGLRDDSHADPAGDGHAQPTRGSDPWPEVLAEADARAQAEADARAQAGRGEAWPRLLPVLRPLRVLRPLPVLRLLPVPGRPGGR